VTAKSLKPDITPKAKKKYLKSPAHCPFCNSTDIEGQMVQVDSGACWQPISCVTCKRKWDDIYKLTDVDATDRD
jgi:transcription elongation factor Elf1